MTRRFSSISVQTTLATGISNTALSMVCATGTASTLLGGISLTAGDVDQFKVLIDAGTANKEIMYVTGVTSDTLTIQRGKDGTSAVAHSGGATIEHVLTGEDLTYFTTGVVPVSDLATGLPFPGSTSGTATLKAPAVAGTTTVTLPGATGTLATLAGTETLSNKTITGLVLSDASVVFEGATADAYETTLTVTDPTADRTITLPDSTGTVALAADVIANTLTTTTGDMIYASAANTPARLPKGNTGDVLTQGATIPGWAAPTASGFVGCAAYRTTNLSMTASTPTAVELDTEDFDTNTFHDTVTNNSRMTIPSGKDGKYLLNFSGVCETGTYIKVFLKKNGSSVALGSNTGVISSAGTGGSTWYPVFSWVVTTVATDYWEVFIEQDGASKNLTHARFSITYLGA